MCCFLPLTPLCLQLLLASERGILLGLSGLLLWIPGHWRKIYFCTKVMVKFNFSPADWARKCEFISDPCRTCFASLCWGLAAKGSVFHLCWQDCQALKALSFNVLSEHKLCHVVLRPFWTLAWPLLSKAVAPQPVPWATVVFYTELKWANEVSSGACDTGLSLSGV